MNILKKFRSLVLNDYQNIGILFYVLKVVTKPKIGVFLMFFMF
jgi:hypothetical protein